MTSLLLLNGSSLSNWLRGQEVHWESANYDYDTRQGSIYRLAYFRFYSQLSLPLFGQRSKHLDLAASSMVTVA